MASIVRRKNGVKAVQFIGDDGKRKTIGLGRCSETAAEDKRRLVERIRSAQGLGDPLDSDTVRWVKSLPPELAKRFSEVGLLPERDETTLAAYCESYIERRHDLKEATAILYRRTHRYLLDHFGEEKPVRDITEGDVDDFRLFLLSKAMKENTVRKHCSRAKTILQSAIRKRLIETNPFDQTPTTVKTDIKRFHYVTREQIAAVIDAAPDAEWRLIIALCRFGGLRCPSEVLNLRWRDIHWNAGRITVHSPKTEHHDGKEFREVPLFPELVPYLTDTFEVAGDGKPVPGELHVITRYRDTNANLRTQLERIVRRAGETPWPKPFNNMRSTRETELIQEGAAMHNVTTWLGNSEQIAAKHYLQTTNADYERFSWNGDPSEGRAAKSLHVHRSKMQRSAAATNALDRKEQKPGEKEGTQPQAKSEVMRPIAIRGVGCDSEGRFKEWSRQDSNL